MCSYNIKIGGKYRTIFCFERTYRNSPSINVYICIYNCQLHSTSPLFLPQLMFDQCCIVSASKTSFCDKKWFTMCILWCIWSFYHQQTLPPWNYKLYQIHYKQQNICVWVVKCLLIYLERKDKSVYSMMYLKLLSSANIATMELQTLSNSL